MNRTGYLTRVYRISRMAVHVLYAVALAGLVFPWLADRVRIRWERRWSVQLMKILQVRVRLQGVAPDLSARNVMLVANHVSWLDIYLLNTARPARFVAKSEVRAWPVVGWLAHKTGTLFIDRTKRHDTARVCQEMSAALNNGECMAVFPEGTTSSGARLQPFHASLLQPVVASQGTLWPVTIRYTHADGSLNTAPAYADEISFGASLLRVTSQPMIYAELIFAPPIDAHGKTRRELAQQTEQTIASALSLAIPGMKNMEPETVAAVPDINADAAPDLLTESGFALQH